MGMVRLVQVIQWRRCWGSGRMGLDTTSTSGERCDECCWGLGRMGTGTTRITDWSFLWDFLDGVFMLHLPQVIMERHRRFTLSSPLSCNTGLVFCNDAPLSLQHSLQALSSSVPTPWLMAPSQKTLLITAGAPLSTVFERRYPALIWGVAAEDRVVGDEEANVEDGHIWGHMGTKDGLGNSQRFKDSSTDKPPPSAPALRYCLKLGDMNEQEGGSGPSPTCIILCPRYHFPCLVNFAFWYDVN